MTFAAQSVLDEDGWSFFSRVRKAKDGISTSLLLTRGSS